MSTLFMLLVFVGIFLLLCFLFEKYADANDSTVPKILIEAINMIIGTIAGTRPLKILHPKRNKERIKYVVNEDPKSEDYIKLLFRDHGKNVERYILSRVINNHPQWCL